MPQPHEVVSDDTILVRRVLPRGLDRDTGLPKATVLNLRVPRGEKSLSFYLRTGSTNEQVLAGAPTPGWGVIQIPAGALRQLGFDVAFETDETDPILGSAHVLATPPAYDMTGQIPLTLRGEVARLCDWVVLPDPKSA